MDSLPDLQSFYRLHLKTPLEDLVPLQKIIKNLSIARESNIQGNRIVLVATGALCPVHLSHVEMFNVAKRNLEDQQKGIVVGGFLSPSHDRYIYHKLGPEEFIPALDRVEMVRLSVEDSDFISCSPWEAAQENFVDFPSVRKFIHTFLNEKFPDENITTLFVCGSDLAWRCHLYNSRTLPVISVGRIDHGTTEKLAKHFHDEMGVAYDAAAPFAPIYTNGAMFTLVTDCSTTGDISSSQIRARLQAGEGIDDLMHPDATRHLKDFIAKRAEGKQAKKEEEPQDDDGTVPDQTKNKSCAIC